MEEKKEGSPKISMTLGRIPEEDEFRTVVCAAREFVAGLSKSGVALYNIEVVRIRFWPGDRSVTFEIVIRPLGVGKFSIAVIYLDELDYFTVGEKLMDWRHEWGRIKRRESLPLESQIAAALFEAARVATLIKIRSLERNASDLDFLRSVFMREAGHPMEAVRSDIREVLKR